MDTQTALVPVQEGDEDTNLIGMWIATKQSEHTRRAYKRIVDSFLASAHMPLRAVKLSHLLSYLDTIEGDDATRALTTNALKSLFTFGTDLGYFPVNVGKALKAPKQRSELAQRILSETEVIRLIDRTENKRDHALLRLLYHSGLRVSEIVALRWHHVRETNEGAVLDVWGKGEKQRYVLISRDMYAELRSLDGAFLGPERYVFQSRKSSSVLLPPFKEEYRQCPPKMVMEKAMKVRIP